MTSLNIVTSFDIVTTVAALAWLGYLAWMLALLTRFMRAAVQAQRQTQEETLATLDQLKGAAARYQAAVEAREASEQKQIGQLQAENADLQQHVIPDDVIQTLDDATAKIAGDPSGAGGAGGDGSGAASGASGASADAQGADTATSGAG